MKRIMFVTGGMGRGGAERVISVLANHYVRQGWEVSILLMLHSISEYELDHRIRIIDISDETINPHKALPTLVVRTRRVVKHERPDVVVGFMAQICLVTWAACMGLGTRVILSERIDPAMVHRGAAYSVMLNFAYAHCDCTVMQTKRAISFFPQSVQNNSRVIPNPIRVYAQAVPQAENRIVTAGRLMEQKNQKMLIRAFANISQKHPEYKLDIYGEGPLQGELTELIKELNLEERVTLKGNVSDVHVQIKDAALFVLPSDYEGLSNALLEAMMMGLPVISTRCAGSDEYIEHGKNGMLIDVGDEAALESCMEELISDPVKRAELARAGCTTVACLQSETVIRQWDEVINK